MAKKKTLREYKFEEKFKAERRQWSKEYRAKRKAEYESCSTLEQRRAFIELMWTKKITVAEAATRIGISVSHAADVFLKNHKKVYYYELVKPEKVR